MLDEELVTLELDDDFVDVLLTTDEELATFELELVDLRLLEELLVDF